MGGEIELVSDGEGVAIIGASSDVERFLLSSGLVEAPTKVVDVQRLRSNANSAGTALQAGQEAITQSGRWVKLTAESAEKVRKYGLTPTKTPGVSHAMIGKVGHSKSWLQVQNVAGLATLTNPATLAMAGAMLQQQAMQAQMDQMVEYLEEINAKVDDILRNQKDAAVADMIGVDLIVEEALTVRDQVGRVSEVTWSKVQATGTTIARTQAYALLQLDHIAEKLKEKSDLGDVAKATREAEPRVREWLAVIARTFQLLDGLCVLELDRVLDASPEELDRHRLGLRTARQNRLELIGRSTARILAQMSDTVNRANSKVLFNPFDSPAAVKSSNQVATGVVDFRTRMGIDADHESADAKRWLKAAAEAREKVAAKASEGVDRATEAFRAVDLDGDGVPDKPRAALAAEEAGAALKGAAAGIAGAFGTLRKRKHSEPRAAAGPEPGSEPAEPS